MHAVNGRNGRAGIKVSSSPSLLGSGLAVIAFAHHSDAPLAYQFPCFAPRLAQTLRF